MTGDTLDGEAVVVEPPVEFVREQEIRQLAPAVGGPLRVRLLPVEIVEVHRPGLVGTRRLGDDPCRRRPAPGRHERRQQLPGQREVAHVVDTQLHLEAVLCLPARDRHHAGVVAEHVDLGVRLPRRLGEGGDGVEIREITLPHVECAVEFTRRPADLACGVLGPIRAPTGHHDRRTLPSERLRRLEAEPTVRTCHYDHCVVEPRHVVCSPVRHTGDSCANEKRSRVRYSNEGSPFAAVSRRQFDLSCGRRVSAPPNTTDSRSLRALRWRSCRLHPRSRRESSRSRDPLLASERHPCPDRRQ